MIKEKATVVSFSGNHAEIQMHRQSACSHCELSSGCGTGAIGRLLGKRSKPVAIETEQNLKPGDQVELGLPEQAFLKASLLIYGLPLLGLFAGSMLAEFVFPGSEPMVFVLALTGLLSGLAVSAIIAKNKYARQFNPEILIINTEPKK
ncbi:MAG: sigma-E factor negative regulatory protein RseC [Gammaproteobacteria bacterium]|jgi:sigma-E factor negative regulatory protein RseC